MLLAAACWLSLVLWTAPAAATAQFGLLTESLNFFAVVPGAGATKSVILVNSGDATLSISSATFVGGNITSFSAPLFASEIPPGGTDTLDVTFAPLRGGDFAAALVFETNLGNDPATRARTSVAVRGQGHAPELDAVPDELFFTSTGVGVPSAESFRVENSGIDSLRVSTIFIGDTRFSAAPSTFTLAPDSSRLVTVTYTATGSATVTATLTIESDDYDQPNRNVALMTTETPENFNVARVAISRMDTLATPTPGDTVSVLVTLKPLSTQMSGVEIFLGYDPAIFSAADSTAPAKKRGLAQNVVLLNNRVVDAGVLGSAVHFSIAFNKTVSSEGELARVDLVLNQQLPAKTLLRFLSDAPVRNTKYVTTSGATVSLPGEAALSLGNLAPRLRSPKMVETEEGKTGELVLTGLAADVETAEADLTWTFTQPDSLATVQVITLPTQDRVAIFTPGSGVSGAVVVKGTVEDADGGRDTTDVILFAADVNDSPTTPAYTGGPPDAATEVKAPVTFAWTASDPDPGDALNYDFLFGTNAQALPAVAGGLTTPTFTQSELVFGQTYFWQVVAEDEIGARTAGSVRSFTAEPDRVAPLFVDSPTVSGITPAAAVVSWVTDEVSDSRLRLATQPDFSDSTAFGEAVDETLATPHSVPLTALLPGTDYYYRAVSADSLGNSRADSIRSFTTAPAPAAVDPGDLNGDRLVNFEDFLIFASAFNTDEGDADFNLRADMDGAGTVAFSDFLLFADVFGVDYSEAPATRRAVLRNAVSPPGEATPAGSIVGEDV